MRISVTGPFSIILFVGDISKGGIFSIAFKHICRFVMPIYERVIKLFKRKNERSLKLFVYRNILKMIYCRFYYERSKKG